MKRHSFLVALLFVALCAPLTAWSAPVKRHIEVVAQSELEVDPDVVDIRFTLSVEKKTPALAVKDIAARETTVLAALKKAGLAANDIQISFLSLYPQFRYVKVSFSGRNRVLKGYRASKTYVACIRDIKKMAYFVEVLAKANVTSFSTSFRSTKVAAHKRKLREMAMRAGKAKAAELAKHAGVQLGAVQMIKELSGISGRRLSNSFAYTRRSSSRGARPGAVKLTLAVRISYAIK